MFKELKTLVFHDAKLTEPEIIIQNLRQVGFKNLFHFVEETVGYENVNQISANQTSYIASLHQTDHNLEQIDVVIKINYFAKNEIPLKDVDEQFHLEFNRQLLSNIYLIKAINLVHEPHLKPTHFLMINVFQKDLIGLEQNLTYAAINSIFQGVMSEYLNSGTEYNTINKLLYDPLVLSKELFKKLSQIK